MPIMFIIIKKEVEFNNDNFINIKLINALSDFHMLYSNNSKHTYKLLNDSVVQTLACFFEKNEFYKN